MSDATDQPDITPQTVLVRSDRIVANDLSGDETVMLDIEQGNYFGVRDVGRVIWEQLAEPTTIDAVCADLLQRFEVDEDTCRREVSSFLQQLAGAGLVEVRGGGVDT